MKCLDMFGNVRNYEENQERSRNTTHPAKADRSEGCGRHSIWALPGCTCIEDSACSNVESLGFGHLKGTILVTVASRHKLRCTCIEDSACSNEDSLGFGHLKGTILVTVASRHKLRCTGIEDSA